MSAIKHHLYQQTMDRLYSSNVNEMYPDALMAAVASRLKRVCRGHELPTELCGLIEDDLIPLLEYCSDWQPGDAAVLEQIESRGVF